MIQELKTCRIPKYKSVNSIEYTDIDVTYQVFGEKIGSAPIVLVNHALTGNSDVVSADRGWWRDLIGYDKLIDLNKYTVLAFNILGNGYDGNTFEDYEKFNLRDIAFIFLEALDIIGIKKLHAIIGGSIGGSLAWEMLVHAPTLSDYIIPIASDWIATDWVLGYCTMQKEILSHSNRPLNDARIAAMLFYRTPQSLTQKFDRTRNTSGQFNIEAWLQHHGNKLESRFDITAYKTMNHLLSTVNISEDSSFENAVSGTKSKIIQIAINTDLFFLKENNENTKKRLDSLGIPNEYHEVKSIHGHDGFLIEHEQIAQFLKPIF